MKQYKINYFKDMKGGVLVTNIFPSSKQFKIFLDRDSEGGVFPFRADINQKIICGGFSCIYGPIIEYFIILLNFTSRTVEKMQTISKDKWQEQYHYSPVMAKT